MFGLMDFLDKNAESAKNICTYMVQCIGNVITLLYALVFLNSINLICHLPLVIESH